MNEIHIIENRKDQENTVYLDLTTVGHILWFSKPPGKEDVPWGTWARMDGKSNAEGSGIDMTGLTDKMGGLIAYERIP